MAKRIAIVLGHPDPDTGTYCHALAHAYEIGAREAGHEVARVDVASLDFKLLRTKTDYEAGAAPAALIPSQQALAAADHWVVIYPLWLGTMPALLKGFLEQTLRDGFAFDVELIYLADKAGLRVDPFPVRLVRNGPSTIRLGRHAPRMLLDLVSLPVRYHGRRLRGRDPTAGR